MISVLAALVAAATPATLPPGPVDFSAQDMRFEMKDRRVLFLDGDVHLKRGDLAVVSDHAVADLADEKPKPKPKLSGKKQKKAPTPIAGGEAIEKFTVDGNVHVARGTRFADGEHGVVDVPAQTLLLTGTPAAPPVLHDGEETLEGERILLHTDTDDVDVQKPRLVLHRALKDKGAPAQPGEAPVPMRVEADHLVLHNEARLARFTDDVVVHRGDAVMKSPRMDARYDKDGDLTLLEMRGGVDMRQGDRRATGQSADYDAKARTMTLLGDPKLYDRGDVLVGDRIELSLDSNEVRVQKGKAHLRPEVHKGEDGEP
jgi:lipopolysaccharide transport protein LptA